MWSRGCGGGGVEMSSWARRAGDFERDLKLTRA
jgi:hypothetical protein